MRGGNDPDARGNDGRRARRDRDEAWVQGEPHQGRAVRYRSAVVTGLIFGQTGVAWAWLARTTRSGKRFWSLGIVVPDYFCHPVAALRAHAKKLPGALRRALYLTRAIERLRRDDFARRERALF